MVAYLEKEERGGGVRYGCFAVGAAQRGHSCGMQTHNLLVTNHYLTLGRGNISNCELYLPKYCTN